MKRKVHQGEIYDKERTKGKLIAAVGKILIKEGFQNLKVNKIGATAGVSKRMIYEYFGDLNGLIKEYLIRVDFWKIEARKINTSSTIPLPEISKEFMFDLLTNDFEYFFKSVEMQKIVLWGISEKNKTIRALTDEREEFGEMILNKTDKIFENTQVDYRATMAILVSSIYYMVLHAKTNGSTMCGIDISKKEGKDRILKALKRHLNMTHEFASVPL